MMAAHLLVEAQPCVSPRPSWTGNGYRGFHRRPVPLGAIVAGSLVLEPVSDVPSSVIALIDATTALVRRVGTCDDHPAPLLALRPFCDGTRVRLGTDHGGS